MNEPLLDIIEYLVIGELRHNPAHLLLVDTDGHDTEYDIACDEIVPIDPDSGDWAIDIIEHGTVLVVPEVQMVASRPITRLPEAFSFRPRPRHAPEWMSVPSRTRSPGHGQLNVSVTPNATPLAYHRGNRHVAAVLTTGPRVRREGHGQRLHRGWRTQGR